MEDLLAVQVAQSLRHVQTEPGAGAPRQRLCRLHQLLQTAAVNVLEHTPGTRVTKTRQTTLQTPFTVLIIDSIGIQINVYLEQSNKYDTN